jgi:hypothetical protein
MIVYFDTNVFDPRDGVPEEAEHFVLNALRSQQFRLLFDLDCFLEPLLAFRESARDAQRAERQLERMLKWCDLRRMVRPAPSLLEEAVLSYAANRNRVEMFVNRGQLYEEIERELTNWDRERSPRSEFWQRIASDAQRDRENFQTSFSSLIHELGPRDGFALGARLPTFTEFWNQHKYRVVETFVESIGENSAHSELWALCREDSVDGLLNIRCVGLAVRATIAHMYVHFYNEGQQFPKVKQSDAADIRHAISAAAADVFVTNDLRLFRRLSVVPLRDFRIMRLDMFLRKLIASTVEDEP